ncbi:hypothetical protein [Fusobacterium polymorphum]|nr:hypothetical protein [Fusobacterium polymorphum]
MKKLISLPIYLYILEKNINKIINYGFNLDSLILMIISIICIFILFKEK